MNLIPKFIKWLQNELKVGKFIYPRAFYVTNTSEGINGWEKQEIKAL